MALDGIFLFHLKNEIAAFANGAFIEKIHQPSKEELVLSLRSREGAKKLLLSCRSGSSGLYFTDFPPENPAKPPMLCMLLRKYLTGARVTSISQEGLERVIRLNASANNELGDRVEYSLVLEIMGRSSNIILTDENGIIIDAVKRLDESKASRPVMPGVQYIPPQPQDKLSLLDGDLDAVKARLSVSGKAPSKAFQDAVMGVSPIICREYENGVTVEQISEYAQSPQPCAVITDSPLDFSFMPITQYGTLAQIKYFDSFSACLDFFYYEKVRTDRINQRSGELFKTLQTLQERAVRKALNREKELADCKDKEKYKIYGDLIIANQYQLQKGALFYDVINYYDNNAQLKIPADPALNPMQNAQKYYKEYRKRQIAESKLSGFIESAKQEAAYLETVIDSLSRAATDAEITEIKAELAQTGFLKQKSVKKNQKAKALKPLEYESSEGFRLLVGRNNLMNDRLTLKTARNYDLWFHVKDCPGSHLIAVNDGREFTDKLIREAAMLAVVNSSAKASSNVAVDYTIVKNVKKPNGAKPGMVIYDDYKTEYVTPNSAELERIKKIV